MVPVPLLVFAASTVQSIVQLLESVNYNKTQAKRLARRCNELFELLQEQVSSAKGLSEGMIDDLGKFQNALNDIHACMSALTAKPRWKLVLSHRKNISRLDECSAKLQECYANFDISAKIRLDQWQVNDKVDRAKDHAAYEALLEEKIQGLEDLIDNNLGDTREAITAISRRLKYFAAGTMELKVLNESLASLQRLSGGQLPDDEPWALTAFDVEKFEKVGEGANAVIFRGMWLGTEVAVKELRLDTRSNATKGNDLKKALMREVLIWKDLKHPHVHEFYGACNTVAQPFMISRYNRKGNILDYLKSNPNADLILLMENITDGMTYLHHHDIMHGDLKGVNVLITDDDRAVISDFGMAQLVSASRARAPFSGTVRWSAPERFQGQPLTHQIDVYAFAMTCYEIISGNVPYGEIANESVVVEHVLAGQRPSRPATFTRNEWNDKVWLLITECWQALTSRHPTRPMFPECKQRLRAIHASKVAAEYSELAIKAASLQPEVTDRFENLQVADSQPSSLFNSVNEPDGLAQDRFAVWYERDVPLDAEKRAAVQWFHKASAKGSVLAHHRLAWSYVLGQGAEQNNEKAVTFFIKATAAGYAQSQYCLGRCYALGRGLLMDDVAAVECYRQAAAAGNADAYDRLGKCYKKGIGVSLNDEKGQQYFREAQRVKEAGPIVRPRVEQAQPLGNMTYELSKDGQASSNYAVYEQGDREKQIIYNALNAHQSFGECIEISVFAGPFAEGNMVIDMHTSNNSAEITILTPSCTFKLVRSNGHRLSREYKVNGSVYRWKEVRNLNHVLSNVATGTSIAILLQTSDPWAKRGTLTIKPEAHDFVDVVVATAIVQDVLSMRMFK